MKKISSFDHEFAFLSNFYHSPIQCDDGITYPTAEHAYQAMKTKDLALRRKIADASTPGRAKRMGNKLELRPDWEDIKLEVMECIIREKFYTSRALRIQLLATGERELEEGNTWGDVFWGVCDGIGDNYLGKTLMKIRTECRSLIHLCSLIEKDITELK